VLKLRVAIRIAAAFQGLAVDLPTYCNNQAALGCCSWQRGAHGTQRIRQLRVALRHPQQRSHRIAIVAGSNNRRRSSSSVHRWRSAHAGRCRPPNDAPSAQIIRSLRPRRSCCAQRGGARAAVIPPCQQCAPPPQQTAAGRARSDYDEPPHIARQSPIHPPWTETTHAPTVPESPISRFRNFWRRLTGMLAVVTTDQSGQWTGWVRTHPAGIRPAR